MWHNRIFARHVDVGIKSRNNGKKSKNKNSVNLQNQRSLRPKSHLRVSVSFGAYVTVFSGYIQTQTSTCAHIYLTVISPEVCASISTRAHARMHMCECMTSNAVERGIFARVYVPCIYVYVVKYKVTAGAETATTTSTRCREKNCRGEGRERRDEAKEGEGRGEGETAMQSFSLSSTLRIPNLGHTDTNAISVPVGERRRRGGKNESRNSCRGGPKVTNLRVATREKKPSVNADCLLYKFGRVTTLHFVLSK